MAYRLKVKDEAEQDIIDGFCFYVGKGSNLGERFMHGVEDVLNYIECYSEHLWN